MSSEAPPDDQGFLSAVIGDGRPLLMLTGLALVLSGAFALFLSATGSFLPHDVDYLGMIPAQLCAINECRIVHFMFHDRVSFGGVLVAIGTLYFWIAKFPLARGEEWAWWTFVLSGVTGFGSFLCYLGYGYLDTWHGAATLGLLPCFILGLWKSRILIPPSRIGIRSFLVPCEPLQWRTRHGFGRILLLFTACGKIGAGAVIMCVGMTSVFVPQDIEFLGLEASALNKINPRLIPLIAHDRAGFGGGLLCCGLIVLLVVWKAPLTLSLWQALLFSGTMGFACAIGIHFAIGYLDLTHVGPAFAGAAVFIAGMLCTIPRSQHSI